MIFLPKVPMNKISIHALREEGDSRKRASPAPPKISIHALREEGDQERTLLQVRPSIISIHALREEGDVREAERLGVSYGISIHAPREEGDCRVTTTQWPTANFYPRPPRGGRHERK